jgi:uncharacterized coiled-coil protein SlyX
VHERSKSVISVDSQGAAKHVDFSLHNQCYDGGLERRDKWFNDVLSEKDQIILELEMRLAQKDEEIKYLVEQLEYLQSKYKQKKMQLSVLKNSCRSEESQMNNYASKSERDIDVNLHN